VNDVDRDLSFQFYLQILSHIFLECIVHLHRRAGIYWPMNMEWTECSETLAYKIQTPGNNPEESIQHSKHGESLKSGIRLTQKSLLYLPVQNIIYFLIFNALKYMQ
jgi:hypothetical protein